MFINIHSRRIYVKMCKEGSLTVKDASFCFRKHYNIKIQDEDQCLIVHLPKKRMQQPGVSLYYCNTYVMQKVIFLTN